MNETPKIYKIFYLPLIFLFLLMMIISCRSYADSICSKRAECDKKDCRDSEERCTIMEEAEARRKPIRLAESELTEYAGAYERGIEVAVEGGGLEVLGYVLVPMSRDKFMVTNGEEQVRFERDRVDRVAGLVVVFRDGREVRFGRKEK